MWKQASCRLVTKIGVKKLRAFCLQSLEERNMIEANKKRLTYVDIGKGLGMMMIVWMHVWGNNTYGFTPPIG